MVDDEVGIEGLAVDYFKDLFHSSHESDITLALQDVLVMIKKR